ncbi:asparagine synthase-related protein [Streptomyces sp. NPDC055189]
MANQMGWYFLALPDRTEAARIAQRASVGAAFVVDHPSGRPWLIGHLPAGQAVIHRGRSERVAVLGSSSATPGDLARHARDLGAVSSHHAGSFCAVSAVDGRLVAQGTASGVRRIFHSLIDGVRVISDRADVLAELGGFPLDETTLALRQVRALPAPLGDRVMWRGVEPVPSGSSLVVDRDGRSTRTTLWWRRPDPELSRAEGARRLHSAIESAVHVRTRDGAPVGADLSGGLDSTPLCYFAARAPGGLTATTAYNDDPGGMEDLRWARMALPSMPGIRHVLRDLADLPGFFGGFDGLPELLDEPNQSYSAGPRAKAQIQVAAKDGISMYLNGLGGDHITVGRPNWEHALFRNRPLLGWRRAREMQIARGQSLRTTFRQLRDNRDYRTWLRDARQLALEGDPLDEPPSLADWSVQFSWPSWLSDDAVAAIGKALEDTCARPEQLGRDRAAHMELYAIREGARIVRTNMQLGAVWGVSYDSPLLDDRVVEACFAVRREERVTPVEFKPLMKEAMRGSLPDASLRRTSKVGGSPQAVKGYQAHYPRLLEMCEESALVGSGIIDLAAFRRSTRPHASKPPNSHVHEVVNSSVFLRNYRRHGAVHGGPRVADEQRANAS